MKTADWDLPYVPGCSKKAGRSLLDNIFPNGMSLSNLKNEYPEALYLIALDVSSTDLVKAAAKAIQAQTEHLDMLINNAGVTSKTIYATIREPQDYDEMHRLYDVNTLGALRVVEAFLPLLERGQTKRLCFISSEGGQYRRGGANELVRVLHVEGGVEYGS